MLVQISWCPVHGRRETALLATDGRLQCDEPVDGVLCERISATELERELVQVRETWPSWPGGSHAPDR